MNARDQVPDDVVRQFLRQWERLIRVPPKNDSIRYLSGCKGRISASRDRLIKRYSHYKP